ncbi:hypothetical protein KC727_02065 [Candidatus Kaiserbacteria bacterium]|nr:hypothetical protein [Candidatus Kaiserbacteria bacterium]
MIHTHSRRIRSVGALCALLLLVPLVSLAAPIVRSGDSVSIGADQSIEGDFYGFGGTVQLSGVADHDVYLAGRSVTVNAPVGEDLVVAGGVVQVHGAVADDLRVVAGEVTLADSVAGDVVVLGGSVTILSTARIGGDLLVLGDDVEISGAVAGSVVGKAQRIRIDSAIGGDVSVTVSGGLTLGDRTEIGGDLEYKSPSEYARAQSAVVVGDVRQSAMLASESGSSQTPLLRVLALLFITLTALFFFKARLQRMYESVIVSYGMQGLIGLGVLIGVPIVGVLLLVSVLGSLVGLVLLFGYVALVIIAIAVSVVVLGTAVLRPFTKSDTVGVGAVFAGVALFVILPLVPFIGSLILFAAVAITLGAISTKLYHWIR